MRKQNIAVNPYEASPESGPLRYHDLFGGDIRITGFAFDNGKTLCRLPETHFHSFNEEIVERSYNTSGGVLNFMTDSTHLSVKVSLHHAFSRSFMTLMACQGLDFYIGKGQQMEYFASAMPKNLELNYESTLPPIKKALHYWSVYLPIFAGIEQLSIGIDPDATLSAGPHLEKKRIVFYGSSITQGIAASRPGNTYVNLIGRKLDAEAINLGFAGNARGETEMAKTIASIPMDAFVMDYDHNSPSYDHLENTHEHFFKIIRERNLQLPIVIVTKPDFDTDRNDAMIRRGIIRRTFENAINAGDKNVYFVDGETLYGRYDRDCCTADSCHPNDLGFYRMAEKISPVLRKALKNK